MARTAHRTLIISAAFALASWALAAGAPVLAAAPANKAGPSLPPAEYKPLPVGTRVTYDTWGYTVAKNDGYDITYKTDEGNWRNIYAVFGRHGRGPYTTSQLMGLDWSLDLDDKSRSALESLWPLKVGKKIVLDLKEEWSTAEGSNTAESFYEIQTWTVTLEVVRTTFLDLNGLRYPTYVIREHTTGKNPFLSENIPITQEYTETRWYHPESGLILKSAKDWTRGPKKGEQEEYSLVRVRFPQGTKTHVLAAATAAPSAPPPAAARPPAARPLVRPPVPARPAMAGPMAKRPLRMPRADLAVAPAGGASLPPAEYKPLPVGTRVTYDTWGYTVSKTEGFDITFKTTAGNWKHYYAVFGKQGDNVYCAWCSVDGRTTLDDKSKTVLEGLWPLKVGKKAQWNLEESAESLFAAGYFVRAWTVTVEVVGTEVLELNGFLYPTYVVKEHAVGKDMAGIYNSDPDSGGYSETKWYNPESGLVLKSVKERMPRKEDDPKEYRLVRVHFPQGTTSHRLVPLEGPAPALAAAPRNAPPASVPTAPAPAAAPAADLELLKREVELARLNREAEIERLKQEAEIERLRREAKRARLEREAELARLNREAKAARRKRANEEGIKTAAAEERLWRSAMTGRKMADVKVYLDRYPRGRFAARAKARLQVLKKFALVEGVDFGRYHALVIGIGKYRHLPRLKTAVNDAKAVAKVLKKDYGFTVNLLIDPDRKAIVDAMDEYRETLGRRDNLLVYYAGHGWLDEESERGYWLPADAKPNRRSKWVSNATVTDTLKTLHAKHVMVVADSCYSGTLTRGVDVGLRGGDYWRRMAAKRARVALVSGGLEPVADTGGGGHSPFAKAFIRTLEKNDAIIDGTTLFNKVRRPVMVSANQTPEYSDVRNAGHDGGDFLFVKRY